MKEEKGGSLNGRDEGKIKKWRERERRQKTKKGMSEEGRKRESLK